MLDHLARLCELRSSTPKRKTSEVPLHWSETCAELKKIDLELQIWGDCYLRSTERSNALSRKAEASRLDFVTTRIMVNQHIRDELYRLLDPDVEVETSSPYLLKTLETIASLRGEVLAHVDSMLRLGSTESFSLAHHRTAIWPLFVVGSDTQTPMSETEWVISQLNDIASTSGLEAASRLANAIFRDLQLHPMR